MIIRFSLKRKFFDLQLNVFCHLSRLSIAFVLSVSPYTMASVGDKTPIFWEVVVGNGNAGLYTSFKEACLNSAAYAYGWWIFNDSLSLQNIGQCIGPPTSLALASGSGYDASTNYAWAAHNLLCLPGYAPVTENGFSFCKVQDDSLALKVVPEKNRDCGCDRACTGNPINSGVGNKVQVESDYSGSSGSPLEFVRTYNSWRGPARQGSYWQSTYDRSISFTSFGYPGALAYRPNGGIIFFELTNGQFLPDSDINAKLQRLSDGAGNTTGWVFKDKDQTENYDALGKLTSIVSRVGAIQNLVYSTAATMPAVAPTPGLLLSVTDNFGHQLLFSYDLSSRMKTMTDPQLNVYTYTYDLNSNLSEIIYPDNKVRKYVYNEHLYTSGADLPNSLTGIIDENGNRFATYKYDTQGKAISTEHSNGVGKVSISYIKDSRGNVISSDVTDALNTTRSYSFTNILGVVKGTDTSQPCNTGCGAASSITYDTNGNIDTKADFNGNVTKYSYDLTRNLEISRTEAFGTPQARTITTIWHATYRLPLTISEPGKTTTFTYDGSGNQLTKTLTDTALNKSRTWTYTYNTPGQVLTEDGPRTDTLDKTEYTYYASTIAGQYTKGDLATSTNALGHVTNFTQYDANGRLLSMTDANGVVTTMTYTPRGWLKTRTVNGSQTTTYDYDGVGQVTKITQPDGSYLSYTYDTAHRLTDITDNASNKIHYTLDAMSNRTKEETFDPTNSLKKVLSREYDALNRLKKDIGGTNPSTQITQYAYDNNGNLTTTTDPLNRVTTTAFDALDRLTQVTDANLGVTKSGLNALDQQTSVTDPRNVVTNYTPNALGDVNTLQSPDSGITNNVYDAAGNLTQKTDARGVVTNYAYDALNRLTSITYPANTAENVSFTYDSVANGNKGIGRLTGYSNTGGTTTLKYDAYGNVIEQADLIGSQIYTTAYQYNSVNQVNQITYPSGRVVVYGRNAISQINLVQTRDTAASPLVTLVNATDYEPFGPIKSLTYGNGVTTTLAHDLDYRASRITTSSIPVWDFVYGYDAAGSIKTITDQTSTFSRTLDYDVLYHLITDTNNTGAWTYQYDANGNRTKKVSSGGTQTLTYLATSNHINKWGSTTQVYDAAGNLTANGTKTYTFNQAGRLATYSSSGAVKAQMLYNAVGQRTQKLQITKPLHQHYDRAGHYLATTSFNADGTVYIRTEWVYLNDMPIAQVRTQYNTNGTVNNRRTNYIHVDHLNTPRLMSDSAKKLVWRLDGDAFGQTLPNQNPDGDGTSIGLDLRFPGQLYDVETGFFYNMYRDYDPFLGRYVERDPVSPNRVKISLDTARL